MTRQLVTQGCSIILAHTDGAHDEFVKLNQVQPKTVADASIEVLTGARLNACNGFIGLFAVAFDQNGEKIHRQVASIVIVVENRRKENLEDYALQAGPSVRTLSDFAKDLQNDAGAFENKQIVFLHGLTRESEPIIAAEIMHYAQTLQTLPGTRTHVLTGNLKVAGSGLEALYCQAKASGALFFKFTDALPTVHQIENSGWEVEFQDEITDHIYRAVPDIIVVDETIVPSAYLAHLAEILRLDTDSAGFLQTENVHRLPVYTNRRGVLAVGPARAVLSVDDSVTEAACAALAVLGLNNTALQHTVVTADINTGQCIRCLTCYRLCPHRAIKRGKRIEVTADACAGCGICFAECPRKAIRLGGLDTEVGNHLSGTDIRQATDTDPVIVAFCCSRSAAQASRLAVKSGQQIPANLKVVTVPCAGALSTGFILEAFCHGAAGVLVLTCHDGNCHSETGNQHAHRRVEHLSALLDSIGRGGNRLAISTLAANMETEFGQIIRGFSQKLHEMEKP